MTPMQALSLLQACVHQHHGSADMFQACNQAWHEFKNTTNAVLVSDIKRTSTPREPIMCHHVWLVHLQPKKKKTQNGATPPLIYPPANRTCCCCLGARLFAEVGRMGFEGLFCWHPQFSKSPWLCWKMWSVEGRGVERALICPICCLGTGQPPLKKHHHSSLCLSGSGTVMLIL